MKRELFLTQWFKDLRGMECMHHLSLRALGREQGYFGADSSVMGLRAKMLQLSCRISSRRSQLWMRKMWWAARDQLPDKSEKDSLEETASISLEIPGTPSYRR